MQAKSLRRVRFGDFQFDGRTGELLRDGTTLRLQPQPAKILAILIARAGEVVTRQELAEQVWGSETFVDFEQGLNYAIRQIRTALEDEADSPRFLETLPKRGYRFIAAVSEIGTFKEDGPPSFQTVIPASDPREPGHQAALEPAEAPPAARKGKRGTRWWIAAALLVTLSAVAGGFRGQLRRWWSPSPVATARANQPIRSLAVLPLVNLTGDPSQESLTDGMTDALIANLAHIRALKVISRTSAMSYKGTRKPLPQIARELGVDAIVEGSVSRYRNRVRVNSQLILASTDEHLWAQNFDRELRDVLVLQNEIARAISEQVQVNLTPAETVHLSTARGVDPEAYQFYLWGRFHVNRRTPGGAEKALAYFQDSIRKDPEFALGYVGLAQSFASLPEEKNVPYHPTYAKAKRAAQRAVQLDENLSEGHAFLALAYLLYEWRLADAELEFRRAIELNPNDSVARRYYAVLLAATGKIVEARAMIRRAEELDPVSLGVNFHAGRILYFGRDYDGALEQFHRTLEIDPNNVQALVYEGLTYCQKGMNDEAIRKLSHAKALSKGLTGALGPLGYAYARAGQEDRALRVAKELQQFSRQGGIADYYLATIYAALGDKQRTLFWLQRAEQGRDPMMVTRATLDPALDSLRNDRRFVVLLTRAGLSQGQDSGSAQKPGN